MFVDKISQEGQPCRKCGTPVVRRNVKKKKQNTRQAFYFESYLFCHICRTVYFVESEKIYINGHKSVEKLANDDLEKTLLFAIFREVLNRSNVSLEIQKQIWKEFENELRRTVK